MNRRGLATILGAAISMVAVVLAFYVQFVEQRTLHLQAERMAVTRQEVEDLSKQLENELLPRLLSEIAAQASSTTPVAVAEKLAAMQARIEMIQNRTLALRQAINPTKPDEILTIARLTDEIKDVRGDLTSFRKQLEEQQRSFQSSILRELNSSKESTNLILLVLLPLVLNFLYTVWKDIKSAATTN